MAAGPDDVYASFGVRKQLLDVGGETLLARMVRQLRERGVEDIVVTEPRPGTYAGLDAECVVPPATPSNGKGDHALNNLAWWSDTDRTVQFFGDTYYTDDAMDLIAGYEPRAWRLFCRYGPSTITGCPYGEVFAVSWWPEHNGLYQDALRTSVALYQRGITRRSGTWEAARILGGARRAAVRRHRWYPGVMVEIDDRTEDFDKPGDFERWLELGLPMAVSA